LFDPPSWGLVWRRQLHAGSVYSVAFRISACDNIASPKLQLPTKNMTVIEAVKDAVGLGDGSQFSTHLGWLQ
jgi:hypothetical protein